MPLSIRVRLTLISAALMAVVLLGLAVFLYVRLEADLRAAVDAGLRSRASVLIERIAEGGGVSGGGLAEGDEAFAQLLGPDGTVVDSSSGLNAPALTASELPDGAGVTFLDRTVATLEEGVPARLLVTRAGDGDALVVGISLEDQQDALAGLASLLLIGIPVAVALAALVGWIVAGTALQPVERMRREADAISASDRGRRLVSPGTRDELSRLADSLNHMLKRLEDAAEQERRFIADASHELRTPLANLRAELDLALRRARTPEELLQALRSVHEETDRLGRLAEDLLVLARFSGSGVHLRQDPADLGSLLEGAVSSFAGRADPLGVRLEVVADPGLRLVVDAQRIRQAVGNLVDNALRHAPAGSTITVTAARRAGFVDLAVTDSGPGFSEEYLPRLGDRFARPDASRHRATGGTGLGLAIVRAIVEAHGGQLRAENVPGGGARVTISLPAEA